MLNLTDAERAFLLDLRALSTDSSGNEIYVGLSLRESERYRFLSDPLRHSTFEEKDEYLALNDKHERVRLQILDAENTRRVENPSQH